MFPLVEEALDINVSVENYKVRIEVFRLDGVGDEQIGTIEYSRDTGDYNYAQSVLLEVIGTDNDDVINIELRESIDEGTTDVIVLAGDEQDRINVYNEDDRGTQRMIDLESDLLAGAPLISR